MRQTASGRAPASRLRVSRPVPGFQQVPVVLVADIEAFTHMAPISYHSEYLYVPSPRARIIAVSHDGPARRSVFNDDPVKEVDVLRAVAEAYER
jgi:hypothetical protein